MELSDNFSRNVTLFRVDNCSPSDTDNLKSDFLLLGEVDTFRINGSFSATEINIVVKQRQSFP